MLHCIDNVTVDRNVCFTYNVSMNSNISKNDNLLQLCELVSQLDSRDEVCKFLYEMLSESEISLLTKRWRILNMLAEGKTQREIAKDLNVSLCKVTRGSKILKTQDAVVTKYLIKEKNNEYRFKS